MYPKLISSRLRTMSDLMGKFNIEKSLTWGSLCVKLTLFHPIG
jgi:hypothetical protein